MSLLNPQLKAFLTVAEQGTTYAAAEVLHITQTAVTQRIKSLESMLKANVFTRSRQGMRLTKEGEALLRYCYAVKNLEGETLAKIQGAGITNETTLILSGPTSIMRSRIIPVCVKLISQYPNLLYEFQINDFENRHWVLKSGKCDFAILQKQNITNEMHYKQLVPEYYVLVCSAKWKGRKLQEILKTERIVDFDPSDQMTLNYLHQFNLINNIQTSRYFVNHTEIIGELVAQGVGYTALPKEFVAPYIKSGDLVVLNNNKNYTAQLYLAWYPRQEAPPYFDAVIQSIT